MRSTVNLHSTRQIGIQDEQLAEIQIDRNRY